MSDREQMRAMENEIAITGRQAAYLLTAIRRTDILAQDFKLAHWRIVSA
jgi:hypothetical protein